MTSDLVQELADHVELLRGTGQPVGLRWEAGDSAAQRRQLIDTQGKVADLLMERGWVVRVGVERPASGVEIFALLIDPDDQLEDSPEAGIPPDAA